MIYKTFDEFESYAEAIEDADMRLIQCQPDMPHWSIHDLRVGTVHLQSCTDGCGNIAEGATRQDGWLLVFIVAGRWGVANGKDLPCGSVLVLPPGAEFCITSPRVHNWVSIFLPTEVLFSALGFSPSNSSRLARIIRPRQDLLGELRRAVARYLAAAEIGPSVATEAEPANLFIEELCGIAEEIVKTPGTGRKTTQRFRRLRQLTSLATKQFDESPSLSSKVADLAQRVDASERAFRNAFAEYYGMAPHRYFTLRRLNHARQLLRESTPTELTIQQVAAEVGFWDFGRFASKYRRTFGELPSETLSRRL
jgi:AraC family transcriptional regulator, ethanolamine operon transcriptional activator